MGFFYYRYRYKIEVKEIINEKGFKLLIDFARPSSHILLSPIFNFRMGFSCGVSEGYRQAFLGLCKIASNMGRLDWPWL